MGLAGANAVLTDQPHYPISEHFEISNLAVTILDPLVDGEEIDVSVTILGAPVASLNIVGPKAAPQVFHASFAPVSFDPFDYFDVVALNVSASPKRISVTISS